MKKKKKKNKLTEAETETTSGCVDGREELLGCRHGAKGETRP